MDRLQTIRQRIYDREIERRHHQGLCLMASLVKDDLTHWDQYAARLAIDLALHQHNPSELHLKVSAVKMHHYPESDRTKLEEQADETLWLLLQGTVLERFLKGLDEVVAKEKNAAITTAAADVVLTVWQHAVNAAPALKSPALKSFVARDPWQIMHTLAETAK